MTKTDQELERLRFPIGRFSLDPDPDEAKRVGWIDAIASLPVQLREAARGLDDAQLDTPYREGGWTVRQLVHHVADSHMHAYMRTKFALTERAPAIKTYDEGVWAELPDTSMPVDVSLALLDALHARWATLLRVMRDEAFARSWVHPEHGERDLDFMIQLYAWHSRHHVAHVRSLRERMGWG